MKHPSTSKWTYGLRGCARSGAGRLLLLILLSLVAVLLLAACASHSPAPPASPLPAPDVVSGLQTASVVDVRQVRRALTTDEAKDYLGNGVCASCHKEVASAHERSTHAHTLRPVTLQKDGPFFRSTQSMTDASLGCAYSTFVSEGKCVFRGRNALGKSDLPAAYVMGSGHNAYTYLSLNDPRMGGTAPELLRQGQKVGLHARTTAGREFRPRGGAYSGGRDAHRLLAVPCHHVAAGACAPRPGWIADRRRPAGHEEFPARRGL